MEARDHTTFRTTLISELASIVNSVEVDEDVVQMDYVEYKRDVISEFLDYYTDALLEYEPFLKEFTPLELKDLRKFVRSLREADSRRLSWSHIRTEAENLLVQLTR